MRIWWLVGRFLMCWQLSNHCNYVNPDTLAWKDFLGTPNIGSTLLAESYSDICLYDVDSTHFATHSRPKVSVNFNSDLSWINWEKAGMESKTQLDVLLAHERLRYIITIIMAKRLKKEVASNGINTYAQLRNKWSQYEVSRLEYQSQYESETDHGKMLYMQLQWEKRIYDEYDALKNVKLDN